MINLTALRTQWLAEQPTYKRLAEFVDDQLDMALRRRGLKARITHREKDAASFVKKAIRKGYDDPIARTTDKAGVRVVVFFIDQLNIVHTVIHDLFDVKNLENKLDTLKTNEVGYLSVHYDVQLKRSSEPSIQDLLEKPCEIQVRTLCQDVYAEMSHVLAYKTELEMPPNILRQVHGMSALLEVADRQFQTVDDMTRALPGATSYRLRAALEMLYYQFAVADLDPDLTTMVLETLLPIVSPTDVDELNARLEEFVQQEQERIQLVFDSSKNTAGPVFLTQPESLLLFFLLERDPYRLAEAWARRLPVDELERLATAWGRPLDVP